MKYTLYNIRTRVKTLIPLSHCYAGFKIVAAIMAIVALASCSTQLEPDQQLYTGLLPIEFEDYEGGEHFENTKAEVEAALATAPNGALFGSSYYRTIPYGLWIYNAFHDRNGSVAKWVTRSFGSEPVLLSNVNPPLRMTVAKNVLQNNGYFRGTLDYEIEFGKFKTTKYDPVSRPRTAKVKYTVSPGHLFTLDSVAYTNFPDDCVKMGFMDGTLLQRDEPFSVAKLDEERLRLYNLFRENGYYFYQKSYASYLADTLKVPGKVQLRVNLADSLPPEAMQRWVIGRMDMKVQRQSGELLTDSMNRRFLTIHFGGKKPPLRPRVILQSLKLMPGSLFSQDSYEESLNQLATKGIFSSASIDFKPRILEDGSFMTVPDTVSRFKGDKLREGAGVLDMTINCVIDKPYDVTFQANYLAKTSGRQGPGVSLGFAKRNAFRGGELLSLNLSANYELQMGGEASSSNSYELAGDISVSFPRLLIPSFIYDTKRKRWFMPPTSMVSVSRETINRGGFFRRHILSAELSYTFQPSHQSRHQFTPLILEYEKLAHVSPEYAAIVNNSPLLMSSLNDYYLQKMRYQYTYTSPVNFRNPIMWNVSVTESSNLLALGYALTGSKWGTKNKKAFNTPFSQFLKLETEFRKTWMVSEKSTFVGHVHAGVIKAFGNSTTAPFSESFYVGGANNVRAFSARSIGPGCYTNPDSKYSYVTNVGDIKLVMNLEYRPHIFGSLYGALFVDAGNVWNFKESTSGVEDGDTDNSYHRYLGNSEDATFKLSNLPKDLALGIGVGLRYDLDFFVLRVDWGIALHTPYDTGKTGYFNIPKFSRAQCLNFAIGYPF